MLPGNVELVSSDSEDRSLSSVQVSVPTISTMEDPDDFDIDREFLDAKYLDKPTVDKIMFQMRNYLLSTQISNGSADGASKESTTLESNSSQVTVLFSNASNMNEESTNDLKFNLVYDTLKSSVFSKLGNVAKRIGSRIGHMFKFSDRSSQGTLDSVTGDFAGYPRTFQLDDTFVINTATNTIYKTIRNKVRRNNDRNQGDSADVTSSCANDHHSSSGFWGCVHEEMKNAQPESRDVILPHSRLFCAKKKNKKIPSKAKDDKSLQMNGSNLFLSNHCINKNSEQQWKTKDSVIGEYAGYPRRFQFDDRFVINTATNTIYKTIRMKGGRNNVRNQGDFADVTSGIKKNAQPESRDDILPHSRLFCANVKNKKIHSKAKDDKSLQTNGSNLFLSNHCIHKNQEQQYKKCKTSCTCPVPIKPHAHGFKYETHIKKVPKINKATGNSNGVAYKKKQVWSKPLNNASVVKEEAEKNSEETVLFVDYLSQSNINLIPMHKPKCTDISLKSINTLKTSDRDYCPVKRMSEVDIMLTSKSASLDLTRHSSVSVIFVASKYSSITSGNSDVKPGPHGNKNNATDKNNRQPFKTNGTNHKIDKFMEGDANLVLLYIAKELQKPRKGDKISDYKSYNNLNCKMLSNIFTAIHHTSKPSIGIIPNPNQCAYMYLTSDETYECMFGNTAYCNIHNLPNNVPMYRTNLHTVSKMKNARHQQSIRHLIGDHCATEEATQKQKHETEKEDFNKSFTGPEIYFKLSFDRKMVHVNIATSPQLMIPENRVSQKNCGLEGDIARVTGRNGRSLSYSESNVTDSRSCVRNTEENSFYLMNDNSCHLFFEDQRKDTCGLDKSDSILFSNWIQPVSRNEVRVNWMTERSTPVWNSRVHQDYLKRIDRRTSRCEEMASSEQKTESRRKPNISQLTFNSHICVPKNGDTEYILGDETLIVKSVKSEIPIDIQISGINKNDEESFDLHRFADRVKCKESSVSLVFSEDLISNLSLSSMPMSLLSATSLRTYIINTNDRGGQDHASNPVSESSIDIVEPFEETRLIENAMHDMLRNFSLNLAFKGYSHAPKPIQVNKSLPACISEVMLKEMPSSATIKTMSRSFQHKHSIIEDTKSESPYISEEDGEENSKTSFVSQYERNRIEDHKSESSFLDQDAEEISEISLLSNKRERNRIEDHKSESSLDQDAEEISETSFLSNKRERNRIEHKKSESSYFDHDAEEISETSLLSNKRERNWIEDHKSESSSLGVGAEENSKKSLLSNKHGHNQIEDHKSEASCLDEDREEKRHAVSLDSSSDDFEIADMDESNASFRTETNSNQELDVDNITKPYLTSQQDSLHKHKHNNPYESDVSSRSTTSSRMHEWNLSHTNQRKQTVSSGLSVNQMSDQHEESRPLFRSENVYKFKPMEKTESNALVVPVPITLFLRDTYSMNYWDSAESASVTTIDTPDSATSVESSLLPLTFYTPMCKRLGKVHRYMNADSKLQRKQAMHSVSQKPNKCILGRQLHKET